MMQYHVRVTLQQTEQAREYFVRPHYRSDFVSHAELRSSVTSFVS